MRKRAFDTPIDFGPDAAGRYVYHRAKPRLVPTDVLQAGRAAATLCKQLLRVEYELAWIYPTTWKDGPGRLMRPADVCGLADVVSSTVYVRADHAAEEAASTIAHESRHIWQHRHWGPVKTRGSKKHERHEDDADQWAASFMLEHWPIDPKSVDAAGGSILDQLTALNDRIEQTRR